MRRKGIAQPWWGGDHADVCYRLSVDPGLHAHSLTAKLRAVKITFGPCPHCQQRTRLYNGVCYAARQAAARRAPRVIPSSHRRKRGRLP